MQKQNLEAQPDSTGLYPEYLDLTEPTDSELFAIASEEETARQDRAERIANARHRDIKKILNAERELGRIYGDDFVHLHTEGEA
jgi:hypothetical protein